jgi:RNA-directed DNA polymerase
VPGRTEAEAQEVRAAIAARRPACQLALQPEKTQSVDGKDEDRRGPSLHEQCACLGSTFRPRRSTNRRGKSCLNCSPAVADKAGKAMRAEMRPWKLHRRRDKSIEELSRRFNPKIRGWLQYDGRYYRSAR